MQDENGYKILEQQLLTMDGAKENGVTMSPDQIYEYSEKYGDDYNSLVKDFIKEFIGKEVDDEKVNNKIQSFYDSGFISLKKKSKKEENLINTDSTLPLEGGVSESGNQNNQTTGDPVEDSYYYGFEHNYPIHEDDKTWPWVKPNYDQNRHVTYNPSSGTYSVGGKVVDQSELSIEDYYQAWVNIYNEEWEGIPLGEEGDYNIFNIDKSTLPGVRINHPSQIIFSPKGDFNIKANGNEIALINNNIGNVTPHTKNSVPSYDIILGLGTGQFWNHIPAGGSDWLRESIPPENRMKLYKDYDGRDVDSEEYGLLNLDDRISDFFYSSIDFEKDFKRINEITKILSDDKNKPFEDRKYYEYLVKGGVDYEGGTFGNNERSETTSETHKSILNGEGDELYKELLGYYQEMENNILDHETSVMLSREKIMFNSTPGGNAFQDNVVLGDDMVTSVFMSGINEDSPIKKDVIDLYRASRGDEYSPVNMVLKNFSEEKGLSETMSLTEYISIIKNEQQLEYFYSEVEKHMDNNELLFLNVGREGVAWTASAKEKEIELFYLNRDYVTANEDERPEIKQKIDELRNSMDWIGNEMFDTDGTRISKPEFDKLSKDDKLRIEKFTSSYNAIYDDVKGSTDRTELLSTYQQIASEKNYLDELKDIYNIKLDSGVEITLGDLINNPTSILHFNNPVSSLYDIINNLITGEESLTVSNGDRKRMAAILENYAEQDEKLNSQLLGIGRFLFLNHDPATLSHSDRDGYFRENALGEGLIEGVFNLWPGNWENIGGERYDFQSSTDVQQEMIDAAIDRNYNLTDEQKDAAKRSMGSQFMHGLGSALPLIVAIAAVTGPAAGYLTRAGIGQGSRLIAGGRARIGSTSTWVNNVNNQKNWKAAYTVTKRSFENSGKVGQFGFRFAEELAKGYLSFEMAGAHGEMGMGIHGGSVIFQSVFPQTKLSRLILWDKNSPLNIRPKNLKFKQVGNHELGTLRYEWVDDAGNIVPRFEPGLTNPAFLTKLTEKGLEFGSATTGGVFGMYLGEVFQHAASNGIDLEAMGRDVFGISMEGEEGRVIEKLLVTMYLSAFFSAAHTYKTGNICEKTLIQYSKDPSVPEGTRMEITSYLDMYNSFKNHPAYQGNKYDGMENEKMWENDPLSSIYNIDKGEHGTLIPRENNISGGFFTKDSFTYNKKTNNYEAALPDSPTNFIIKRQTKKNGGEFYITVNQKRIILGKTLKESATYLNDFLLQRQTGILDTQDPRAGIFEEIRSYNRESVNKEQASSHKKTKLSVFNDMSGNMLGKDGYMLKMFPELRVEIPVGKENIAGDIFNYKKSVKDILERNPNLDVVTYEQNGKIYIELMARTESLAQAQNLAKRYNIGTLLNLKDGKDINVEISGPDINTSKTENIYNEKSKQFDFNKSGLSILDKNNVNFDKNIVDRITDISDMSFQAQKRGGAINKIDVILDGLKSTRSGINPINSSKFWKMFQKELKNDEVLSMEEAFNNVVEAWKGKNLSPEFISKIEKIGASKMINQISPINTMDGIPPNMIRYDGVVSELNDLFSFKNKPELIQNEFPNSVYELDSNGKPVMKDKNKIYNQIKEGLDNVKKQEKNNYWYEHVWEWVGNRIWSKDKVIKDALKYENRWLKDLYKEVWKDNPELAAWLKKKGDFARIMKENSAGASGLSKIMTRDLRLMFSKMTQPQIELFENILYARHAISMDISRDAKKVDLDGTIQQLNLMMEQGAPKADIDAIFESAKLEAERIGISLKDPSHVYEFAPGIHGKYSISTKDGKAIINESNVLENGRLNIKGHLRIQGKNVVYETPWRLEHGRPGGQILNKETAETFLEKSKEINNGSNKESSSGILNMFEKYNTPSFDKVNQNVDKYFKHGRLMAEQMFKAGIIDKKAYETMIAREYIPREFVEYAANLKNGTNSTGGENIFDPLKVLEGGYDTGPLSMDARTLMINKTQAVQQMVWANNVRKSIADNIIFQEKLAVKYGRPGNYKDFGFTIDKTKKQSIESRAKELGVSKENINDFIEIEYRVDGKSYYYGLHKDLHQSMVKKNWWSKAPLLQKFFEVGLGSTRVRATTTVLEWSFMPVNFIRDSQNILFNRDIYSPHIPEAIRQYTGDIKNVSKAAFSFDKSNNPLIKKFYERGGSLDFLTTEGRRIGSEENPFMSYTWFDKMVKENKYLYEANRTRKNLSKGVFDVLSYLGESSELLTRLATFERQISNRTKEFESQYNRSPNEKELIDLEMKAANDARNNIDFNQGGDVVKFLDAFIPYTNASVQGFRVFAKNVKENPKQAAYKYAQFASYTGGLAMYNWENYPDEMKQLWETQPYEFMNNFIFFLPYKNEAGNQTYIKLPKEHSALGYAAYIEGAIGEAMTGTNYITQGDMGLFVSEENKSLLQRGVEMGTPFAAGTELLKFWELKDNIPLLKALRGYQDNWDSFRHRKIYYNDKHGGDASEEINYGGRYNSTNPMMIDLAGGIESLTGTDISPARLEYFMEAIGYKGSIFEGLQFGYNEMFQQPNEKELRESVDRDAMNIIDALLGKSKDRLFGSVDMSFEVSDIILENQRVINDATKKDKTIKHVQSKVTTYFIDSYLDVYKKNKAGTAGYTDNPLTEENEFKTLLDEKENELENFFLNMFQNVDGISNEDLYDSFERTLKSTKEEAEMISAGITFDIRDIWAHNKTGQSEVAARKYFYLINSLHKHEQVEILKQATSVGLFSGKDTKFEKEFRELQEVGWEEHKKQLDVQEKYYQDVKEAIFKDRKFSESYLNGEFSMEEIDFDKMTNIAPWHEIMEEVKENGEISQEFILEVAKKYIEEHSQKEK